MVTPGTPPVPHVGGPITGPCSPSVFIGGLLAARVTDMSQCVGPPDTIAMGSATVLINGLNAARIGDPMIHGGKVATGFPTVLIGDSSAGGYGDMGGGNIKSQVAALKRSAASGKPFCEECYQQALARAG